MVDFVTSKFEFLVVPRKKDFFCLTTLRRLEINEFRASK